MSRIGYPGWQAGQGSPLVKASYEKLPCGRRGPHGLSHDQVAADQRRRLHAAMVQAVAEHGYAAVTVNDVVALAGVSKKTLYKHFGSKQECFLGTCDLLWSGCTEQIAASYRKEPPPEGGEDWKVELCGSLEAFFAQVAAQPQRAWLMLVEVLLVGRCAQGRVEHGELALQGMIERGFALAPEQIALSPILTRGIVHGIWHLARERLIEHRPESLPGTGPQLLEWMLSYRVGGVDGRDDKCMPLSSGSENGSAPGTRNEDRRCVPGDERDERTRLLRAAAQIIAAGGYEALTGLHLAEQAGVREGLFDELFGGSVEECLLAYLEFSSARALARALNAARNAPDWPSGVYRAIDSLLGYVAEDRAFARVAFVEIFTIGRRGLERRAELMRRFSEVLLRRVPRSSRPSPLVAEAITGAVWSAIHREVVHDRAHRLQTLTPQVAYLVLAPLTGGDVEFELDERGARLRVDRERAAGEIARLRGAGDVKLSTDEILALTRR
jgi:AcrR family transcriptional regulator